MIQVIVKHFIFNCFEYIISECAYQNSFSHFFTNPARAQVEHRFIIKLAYCRAVRTLHIISVNFKLRLCINCCCIRKQDCLVGLVCISFLRVFPNEYFSVENAASVVIQHALIHFIALAMRFGMVYQCVIIHMLAAFGQV